MILCMNLFHVLLEINGPIIHVQLFFSSMHMNYSDQYFLQPNLKDRSKSE